MDDLKMNRQLGTKWFTFYTKVRPWLSCLGAIVVLGDFMEYQEVYLSYWWMMIYFLSSIAQAVLSIMVFIKSKEDYEDFVRFVKGVLIFETINISYELSVEQYIQNEFKDGYALLIGVITLVLGYFLWYRLNMKYFQKRIKTCFCRRCGNKLSEDSLLCNKCGAKVLNEDNSEIFSLPENLYAQGVPVVIKSGVLLKDNESGCLIGQLKLHSISNKRIKLVKVELTCLDSLGRQLNSPIVAEYLDLMVTRGVDFGTKTPISIANQSTRSYTVKVIEVGFEDNTVWRDNSDVWKPMPRQTPIESILNNNDAVKGYKSKFGPSANMAICEHSDLWICACGEINHDDEERCYKCNVSYKDLKNIDINNFIAEGVYVVACNMAKSNDISVLQNAIIEFNKIKDYKDASTLAKKCESRILEIQKTINANKTKLVKIISFVAGGLVILALLGYFGIYPLVSYLDGDYAVYINMYNVEEFSVPEGVTSISDRLFLDCKSLTSIEIPDSVTSIGDNAFLGCASLTSIEIPDSVTSIGDNAFLGCASLTSIEIPDSVTSIGDNSFSGCASLTSIEIPDSVTSIGDNSFSGCASLTSIEIPDSVTNIGHGVFKSCTSLTNIEIPDSVTSIGDNAFLGCASLTSIEIPDSVTNIGYGVFKSCTSLTSIEIPNSVTNIPYVTFEYCTSLKRIEIPQSVTSIGNWAFKSCTSLETICFQGEVEEWNEIKKYDWNYLVPATEVICSDGTVPLK